MASIQSAAAEIKLRAERRAGQLMCGMEKSEGGRPSKTGNNVLPVSSYSDLGINKMVSHRWQQIAGLDDEAFEGYVASALEACLLPTLSPARIIM